MTRNEQPQFRPISHMRDPRLDRPWRIDYELGYDTGWVRFSQYYRTLFGARWSAFWHVKFRSWGGSALLFRNRR